MAQGVGADEVIAYCNSQLVVNQFNGDYEAKDSRMEAYLEVVKDLVKKSLNSFVYLEEKT